MVMFPVVLTVLGVKVIEQLEKVAGPNVIPVKGYELSSPIVAVKAESGSAGEGLSTPEICRLTILIAMPLTIAPTILTKLLPIS
jgi:hypothetical protein